MKQIMNKTKTMLQIEHKECETIEELLRKKYVDENKSTTQIVKELHIDRMTLYKWLSMAGIHSRKLTL